MTRALPGLDPEPPVEVSDGTRDTSRRFHYRRSRRRVKQHLHIGHARSRVPIRHVDTIPLATFANIVGVGADIELGFVLLAEDGPGQVRSQWNQRGGSQEYATRDACHAAHPNSRTARYEFSTSAASFGVPTVAGAHRLWPC